MTTNNELLIIGRGDPIYDTFSEENCQYILNWIAAGGDQKNTDSSGNNFVKSIIATDDLSYNIPDNRISFYFTDVSDHNISIRDSQHVLNKIHADNYSGDSPPLDQYFAMHNHIVKYIYPKSNNFTCLIIRGNDVTIGIDDGNNIILKKNMLYLKNKNFINTNSPDIFNKYILTNSISCLNLTSGNIIKRKDIIDNGSNSIQFYKINNELSKNTIIELSGSSLDTNLLLQANSNNIFPPSEELLYNSNLYFKLVMDKNVLLDSRVRFITPSTFSTIHDGHYINILRNMIWYDNPGIITSIISFVMNSIYSINWESLPRNEDAILVTDINFDSTTPSITWHDLNNKRYHKTITEVASRWWYSYSSRILLLIYNIPIYTYLGINNNLPDKDATINYHTEYNTINNKKVNLQNYGIQNIKTSNNKTLTILDTISHSNNILNNAGFNKTSWVTAGENMNDTQGHFVGNFVFDVSATGTMIYQYYYSIDCDDSIIVNNKSPYTIYFNISNGHLLFPEKWPTTTTLNSILSTRKYKYFPWIIDSDLLTEFITYIYVDIFKQDNLRWCYNYNADNNIVKYKIWNKFNVIDGSCSCVDTSGTWADYSTGAGYGDKQYDIYKIAYDHVTQLLISNAKLFNTNLFIRKFGGASNILELYYTSDPVLYESEISYIHFNDLKKLELAKYTNVETIYFNKAVNMEHPEYFGDCNYLKRVFFSNTLTSIDRSNIFSKMQNVHTLVFFGRKPEDKLKFNDLEFTKVPNLKNIYYIEGQYGWSNENIFSSDTKQIIQISSIPYNNNLLTSLITND